jgi:hypothetical protein
MPYDSRPNESDFRNRKDHGSPMRILLKFPMVGFVPTLVTLEVRCRLFAGEACRLSVFLGMGIIVFGLFRDDAGGGCNQFKDTMLIGSTTRSEMVGRDGNGLVLPTMAVTDTWKRVEIPDSRNGELHGD